MARKKRGKKNRGRKNRGNEKKFSAGGSPFDDKEDNRCCTLPLLKIGVCAFVIILGVVVIYNSIFFRTNPIVDHPSDLIKSPDEIPLKKFVFMDECQKVSIVPTVSSGKMSFCLPLKLTDSQIPIYIKFDSMNFTTQSTLNHFAFNGTCLEIFVPSETTLQDGFCWKISVNLAFDSTNSHWVTENFYHFVFNDRCQEISVLPDMILKDVHCWKFRTAADSQSDKASSSNNQASTSSRKKDNCRSGNIQAPNRPNKKEVDRNVKAMIKEKLMDTNESLPELYCKNSQGQNVDWYYVIKLPKMPHSTTERIKKGTGFYYLDNESMKFQLSQTPVDQAVSNPIANTLNQIYDPKVMSLIYNDHFPDEKNAKGKKGHAKGVVANRPKSGGFWMIHSIPEFPNHNEYPWPTNAKPNGQNVLCVSLPSEEISKIMDQLQIIEPHVYFKRGTWEYSLTDTQEEMREQGFYTRNQMKFVHLAKSPDWNEEFYSTYVARNMESELHARTWRRGIKAAYNKDSDFPVRDIKKIIFPDVDAFADTKDHSKWAISEPSRGNKKIVCVGDLNREVKQSKRGGGTMCAEIHEVWKAFKRIINEFHPN